MIGNRWIELSELDMASYKNWQEFPRRPLTIRLLNVVNEQNWERCLKLCGLPYDVFKWQIVQLFQSFHVLESDITIELIAGKKTGYAIVELQNKDERQRAISQLNGKKIGSRWIKLENAKLSIRT